MKKLLKAIDHNQGLSVAVILILGLTFWAYGCESQVNSLSNPGVKINRVELQQEVKTFLANAEIRLADLDRQDEIKRAIFNFAALTAEAGTFNPTGLISLASMILLGGVTVDNSAKNKLIKANKK